MYGSEEIYQALNISDITTGLDVYKTGKALFIANVLPADFTGFKSINFYMSTPFNGADSVKAYNYSINCRAKTYNESLTIAKSVVDNINRSSYSDFYITCSVVPTIPPADDSDVYNTPVEAILKTR